MKNFIFYYQTCYAKPEKQELADKLLEKFGCKAVKEERQYVVPSRAASFNASTNENASKVVDMYEVRVQVVSENTTDNDLRALTELLTYILEQKIFFIKEA